MPSWTTLSHTSKPGELEGALLATYLLPSNTSKLSKDISVKIKPELDVFLPHPSSFESESLPGNFRWQSGYTLMSRWITVYM